MEWLLGAINLHEVLVVREVFGKYIIEKREFPKGTSYGTREHRIPKLFQWPEECIPPRELKG